MTKSKIYPPFDIRHSLFDILRFTSLRWVCSWVPLQTMEAFQTRDLALSPSV